MLEWLHEQAPGAPDLLHDGEPDVLPTWDQNTTWPTSFEDGTETPSMEDIATSLATEL